jgi:hypothetical protein
MCRRCGAPLRVPIIESKIPARTALQGRSTDASASPGPRAASRPPNSPVGPAPKSGYSLPSNVVFSRPDNLLPRAIRKAEARRTGAAPRASTVASAIRRAASKLRGFGAGRGRSHSALGHWRPVIVTGAIAIAVTTGAIAIWPAAFGGGTSPRADASALNEERATHLLRTVVAAARSEYKSQHSYASLHPWTVSARAHSVPVVGPSTVARSGGVSLRVDDAKVVTLASPADRQRCVFARDDATRVSTVFVTVSTSDCRASAAPDDGWSAR